MKSKQAPTAIFIVAVIILSGGFFARYWTRVLSPEEPATGELLSEMIELDTQQQQNIDQEIVENDLEEPAQEDVDESPDELGANIDRDKPSVVYYYGETCPYCHDVSDYIAENNLDQLISIERKEIYNNQANQQEFQQAAEDCGIDRRGVPFLVSEGECFIGFPSISEELDRLAETAI